MKYKMTDERWESIHAYLNYAIRNPEKVPDKGVLLALSTEELSHVFTKKRLELINAIKGNEGDSVSALSKNLGRKLSAVDRDLKTLENFGIVALEKKGRVVTPSLKAEILLLPLVEAKRLEELVA